MEVIPSLQNFDIPALNLNEEMTVLRALLRKHQSNTSAEYHLEKEIWEDK